MSIIGDIKGVAGDLQKLGNIDLYNRLIAIQEKVIDIIDMDVELKEKNVSLKSQLEIKEIIEFRDDVYWLNSDKPGEKGPYCSRCYDTDRKLIHLHNRSDPKYATCPSCKIIIEKRWR